MMLQIKLKICSFLYKLNVKIFKYVNKIDTAPIFKNENSYDVVKINFSDSEMERIKVDMKNKNYIEKKI